MNWRQRWPLLVLFLGTVTAATAYLVIGGDGKERICGLPSLGPVAIYTALAVPLPTGSNGTGAGDCMLPADAEDALRKGRVAAAVLPKWRSSGIANGNCLSAIFAVEYAALDGGAAQREVLVRVCDAPPVASATAAIERLERLPGTSVRMLPGSVIGPFAKPGGARAIQWWARGSFPATENAILPCACCARGQACAIASCLPDGGSCAGAPVTEYEPASRVSGVGKRLKTCGEDKGVAEPVGVGGGGLGLGYSFPAECL